MLPPLMFSEEEIEALVLGSRWVAEARRRATQQGGPQRGGQDHCGSARRYAQQR
jgi:predicted DNA-binding transcriptional regulator YafY